VIYCVVVGILEIRRVNSNGISDGEGSNNGIGKENVGYIGESLVDSNIDSDCYVEYSF
jgi:hypothetical protein